MFENKCQISLHLLMPFQRSINLSLMRTRNRILRELRRSIKLNRRSIKIHQELQPMPISMRMTAAEALGAIGSEGVVTLLKDTLIEDPILEVQEACELALRRIMEQKNIDSGDGTTSKASPFHTVDPAMTASLDCFVDQLREVLLNEEEGIYESYAALFALRNQGDDTAVRVIIESLGARSALLRHEVLPILKL